MEPFFAMLKLPPVVALIVVTFGIAVFVAWKLAKIDSRTNYLLKAQAEDRSENKKDHDTLWTQVSGVEKNIGDMREDIGEIKGYIQSQKDSK